MGCGQISQKHARILTSGRLDARLVAVCDIDPERVASFSSSFRVPGYNSLHEMIDEVGHEIDVVNVCTPSGCHADNAMQIASYKKHIVVEKPLALKIDDGEKIVEHCDRAGVKLFVVWQNRFNYPVQKLHETIKSGRFGKIVMACARVRWRRDQSYYDRDAWRGTWQWDGGVFANQASHLLDLLMWFVGDLDSVFAYTSRSLVDIECEDTGIAMLRFSNGALGVLEATTAVRPNDMGASISILGERGTVEIGGYAVNKLTTWEFFDADETDEQIRMQSAMAHRDGYGFAHREFFCNVIDNLRHNRSALVNGLEGLKSVHAINAIYESAETGAEVGLRAFVPRHVRLGSRRSREGETPAMSSTNGKGNSENPQREGDHILKMNVKSYQPQSRKRKQTPSRETTILSQAD